MAGLENIILHQSLEQLVVREVVAHQIAVVVVLVILAVSIR